MMKSFIKNKFPGKKITWSFIARGRRHGLAVLSGLAGCHIISTGGQVITPVSAVASSFYSSAQDPSHLIDGTGLIGGGNILTNTAAADIYANGMWHSDGSAVNGTWVAFDLGAQYTITIADIWQMNESGKPGRGVKDFAIYTSSNSNVADATNFAGNFSLGIGSDSDEEPVQHLPLFDSNVRLVKFVVINDWNGLANDYVGLSEVRFETSQVITPASATASSYYSIYQSPDNLINGTGLSGDGLVLNQTHDNDDGATSMWHTDGGVVNGSWAAFDLGTQYTLTAADIWQMNQSGKPGRGVKSFSIYTSPNATDPITNYVGSFNLKEAGGTAGEKSQFLPFDASPVRRIKFIIANDWNGTANDYVGLSEVRFEGSAVLPVAPPITAGLAGYWKFDEAGGSTAHDSSGNGRSGMIYNTSGNIGQWTSGKIGGALSFRGTGQGDDFVIVSNWPVAFGDGMTLSAWVLADANTGDALTGAIENSGQIITATLDAEPLPPTSWQHVVMVVNGENLLIYRNGILVGAGSYHDSSFNPNSPLTFGALAPNGGAVNAFWQGKIDEVACWSRPLQPTEVFKIFAAGYYGASVTSADSYLNSPPLFVKPLPGGNCYLHEPFWLTAEAAGFGPLTYQWWKDGLPLANGNTRIFTNPHTEMSAAGQYWAVVTDGNGRSATSSPATITVKTPQLEIGFDAGNIYITWPAEAAGYQLESAGAPDDSWNVMPGLTTNFTILPATNSSQFYRLRGD